MSSVLSLKILSSTIFSAAQTSDNNRHLCRAQLLFLLLFLEMLKVLTKNSLPVSVIFPILNRLKRAQSTLGHICMTKCLFPSQICLMSKPGDQHGQVTATPALSQKVKASAQLGKHGLDSKGNCWSSGGVLSVLFWKASCIGSAGRYHWAATSFLKLHQVHHHRALKSFL